MTLENRQRRYKDFIEKGMTAEAAALAEKYPDAVTEEKKSKKNSKES
tara:strand:- start:644 stop:784 length:141 start_codon:yes stop_codon:yes gene_type:complete